MKPVTFKSRINGELFLCENPKTVQQIDSVDYLFVRRENNPRVFMMRKDVLERVRENFANNR